MRFSAPGARLLLIGGLAVTLAALCAPVSLIHERGSLLQGLVGSYGYFYAHDHHFFAAPIAPSTLHVPTTALHGARVPIEAVWPAGDLDQCDGEGCPLPQGHGIDTVTAHWSDGGAGGSFGYLDANGAFVASDDPFLVTHYQPAESGGGGLAAVASVRGALSVRNGGEYVVQLGVHSNDAGGVVDPETGEWTELSDDPAVTTTAFVVVSRTQPESLTVASPAPDGAYGVGTSVSHHGTWTGAAGVSYWQEAWVLGPEAAEFTLVGQTAEAENSVEAPAEQSWSAGSTSVEGAGLYHTVGVLVRREADGTVYPAASVILDWTGTGS